MVLISIIVVSLYRETRGDPHELEFEQRLGVGMRAVLESPLSSPAWVAGSQAMMRSRYSLRVNAGPGDKLPAVSIDDHSANVVLFHWHGPEARCLLESHDMLRQHAMDGDTSDRCVPISKTSIWHLALHVAAIRCLLNRCSEEFSAGNGLINGRTLDEIGHYAKFNSLHRQVMNILRSGSQRLLSAPDITCLLALEGRSYSANYIGLVLDDLCRWGAARCCLDDENEILYGTCPTRKNSFTPATRLVNSSIEATLSGF